ncbi:phosphoinositide 3-kinase regulatory subunit 4-like [Styela clava]
MGNHLAATAPSQILSVDSYLGDATDYQFDKSLGSTRFMKVARVKHQEGLAVVKVFAIHDPNLDLETYKQHVENIRSKLKHASNCSPFQNIMLTDKAALLFRQFVKHNLYDRISTRPFYNMIERKWVAFQLLCALNQMAKLEMCHGDIKSENVMITSWNWLLLTDFASYKPTYIPDDNPADFNYFFDTSRRRVCYIAPERFVEMSLVTEDAATKETQGLDHSMDIFSAGCVIAELFTDGTPPFDFSQLLAFRQKKYYPTACLAKIDDPHIKSLVEHMIQRDPRKRFTAEQYLTKWKGKAFPVEFYSHLKKYLGRFCEPPLLSADQTINTLHSDLSTILQNLVEKPGTSESLIIVATIALSCLRRLKYCNCKLRALGIITEFSKYLSSIDILERIVPYLMESIEDKMPRVRAEAFHALAICTSYVHYVPQAEVNIFSEFIFPGTSALAQDKAVLVRQTYAENLSLLAETALRFLNSSKFDQSSNYISTGSNYQPGYDNQLQNLHETVQESVQALFSDNDSTVRQCLLEHSVAKLCNFFGRQRCNDVILSHMITFLNDKQDWQLRSAFFDSLVQVAMYIGWQCTVILKPLLQQGLNDSEEFVIGQTLNALTSLTKVKLLSKQMTFELLRETIPLLQHPCKWIRFNTVGFISASSKSMNIVDLHCHVLPKLDAYLTDPIIQPDSESSLLSVLKPGVQRQLYELVLSSSHIGTFLNHLQARKMQRHSYRKGEEVIYDDVPEGIVSQTFHKLKSHGLEHEDEEKLLNLCEFLQRQSRHRATLAGINTIDSNSFHSKMTQMGQLDVALLGEVTRRHAELVKPADEISAKQSKKTPVRKKPAQDETFQSGMNEEWKSMFGENARPATENTGKKKAELKKQNLADAPISMSQLEGVPVPAIKQAKVKPPNIQLKYTSCKLNLRKLVHHKRNMYLEDVKQRELEESISNSSIIPEVWRPRGQLIAHMVEHHGPIHRIAVSPSNDHFATVSSDKTLKLWDCEKLAGKAVINQSKATYGRLGKKLYRVTFCGDDKVVCSTESGGIHCIDIETLTSRTAANASENVFSPNMNDMSRVMDITAFYKSPVIVCITAHGSIDIWDMREKSLSCTLQHDLHDGLMTSLVVDPKQHWLCVATVSGKHICWDLRFCLPITHVTHPSAAGVRRMAIHPSQPSCVISAVTGNNEVTLWDLETSSRNMTLWASTAPAMSLRQKSQDSVNGLLVTQHENDVNIYTAGTDSVIRLWDMNKPVNSKILSEPSHQSTTSVSYDLRRVEGTDVIQEHVTKAKSAGGSTASAAESGPELRSNGVETCHRDVITDMAMFRVNQTMLVSASRDGVVKIWK